MTRHNFAGTYQLSTAVVTSNTCGGSVFRTLRLAQVGATQNGRNVTWVDSSWQLFTGSVDADNGGFSLLSLTSNGVECFLHAFRWR